MSAEYKQRYVDKISDETTHFLGTTAWPSAEAARLGMITFIKRRTKHYGLRNKYLPADFKKTPDNGSSTDGATANTNREI